MQNSWNKRILLSILSVEQKKTAGEHRSCPVHKPEDMEIEEAAKDGHVAANNEKIEKEMNDGETSINILH